MAQRMRGPHSSGMGGASAPPPTTASVRHMSNFAIMEMESPWADGSQPTRDRAAGTIWSTG
eukprot:9675922-Lingulodinium_polyedra.AAC.1